MTQRTKHTQFLLGGHRGGTQYVHAMAQAPTQMSESLVIADRKEGRAAALAAYAKRRRFPARAITGVCADGRDAIRDAAPSDVVVATMDSVGATAEVLMLRRSSPTIFQILGRTGGSVFAPRFAVSGLVDAEDVQRQALGLLAGFHSLSEEVSSRTLTDAGDPLTALLLKPLRDAAASTSAHYMTNIGRAREDRRLGSLTLILPGERMPLTVMPFRSGERFSMHEQLVLDSLSCDASSRRETLAVALVSIEEHVIDLHLVFRSGTDFRRIERVIPLRPAAMSRSAVAAFSD